MPATPDLLHQIHGTKKEKPKYSAEEDEKNKKGLWAPKYSFEVDPQDGTWKPSKDLKRIMPDPLEEYVTDINNEILKATTPKEKAALRRRIVTQVQYLKRNYKSSNAIHLPSFWVGHIAKLPSNKKRLSSYAPITEGKTTMPAVESDQPPEEEEGEEGAINIGAAHSRAYNKAASREMKLFHQHKLHSGSKHGPIVTNPHQAGAIAHSVGLKASHGGGGHRRKR